MMRIKEIIKEQGMTTKEVAEKMGISISALNQHISGNPSVKVLNKISDILNVPMWQLFASPNEIIPASGNGRTIRCPKCGQEFEVELKPKGHDEE